MKKITLTTLVGLFGWMLVACSSGETNATQEATTIDSTMTEEKVVTIETKTEEITTESKQMETSVEELSNDVDSLLSDI